MKIKFIIIIIIKVIIIIIIIVNINIKIKPKQCERKWMTMSQAQRINFITSKYNKLYNQLQKVVS